MPLFLRSFSAAVFIPGVLNIRNAASYIFLESSAVRSFQFPIIVCSPCGTRQIVHGKSPLGPLVIATSDLDPILVNANKGISCDNLLFLKIQRQNEYT
jgi:hypothetical protein